MAPASSMPVSSRPDERVMVFIDGSNLYHVLGDVCGRHDLQFDKFGAKLANGRNLRRIYYYNIKQESERQPEVGREQDKFLQSLYEMPYLEVKFGIWKQRGEEMVEKGVDVMLATDVVVKALRDQYDTAIIVSGDADFFPAMQAAKESGKQVEVAAFEANLSPEAARHADVIIRLNKTWFTGLWTTGRGGSSRKSHEPEREEAPAAVEKPAPRTSRKRVTRRSDQPSEEGRAASRPAPEREAVPAARESERRQEVERDAGPSIRRTPARRRVGGTAPSNNGHRPDTAEEGGRPVPTPPPLRGKQVPPAPLSSMESREEQAAPVQAAEAAERQEERPANGDAEQDAGRRGTRVRGGWLRRIGFSSDDEAASAAGGDRQA